MRRGDVVLVAAAGDYGKPRPAVVVSSNALLDFNPSVAVCQLTSTIGEREDFRIAIYPSVLNGLRLRSVVMIEKPLSLRQSRVSVHIGKLSDDDMERVNAALAFALGLSD